MKRFTRLYFQLDATTSTKEKTTLIAEYLQEAPTADALWAIALFSGRRPKRPVASSLLRAWCYEAANIPEWLFEECYAVAGDLAETISLLVNSGSSSSDEPLSSIMEQTIQLREKTDAEKKEWIISHWRHLSRDEVFVLCKLITGSFRVGVSQQIVAKAIAQRYKIDEKEVAHRLMGKWDPATDDLEQLLNAPGSNPDASRPYPFYLAYQLDVELEALGDVKEWQIERKYDGIRGQMIVREGSVFIWSRGEDLMNDKFTELLPVAQLLENGTVIDGEILPVKDDRILSFAEMQKRIGRKNVSSKMLAEIPLCMMCYDLLELKGRDLRAEPLYTRRKLLERVIADCNSSLLRLSPLLAASSWSDLEGLRNESRMLGCEGLMLKHSDSVYETGRRRGKWWKWKVDPLTVDAVLIYAQPGHGKRAGLYTDYTFAIRDGDNLLTFAKAYSGLTNNEIVEVDRWIKRNTVEKFGPVRSVKPELVFELAFEGISISPRHKSGLAVRFPRIQRWRKDKHVSEINTKDDLLQLLNAK
jgi:DNA ligase 1